MQLIRTEPPGSRSEQKEVKKMKKETKYNGYLRKSFTYDGKRIYIYGRTKDEIFENEKKKKEELKTGQQDRENPTLFKYYDYFTQIRRAELKESTLRGQRIQFNLLANTEIKKGFKFGNTRIKDITRRDIEQIRQTLLESGQTPEHLNICFAHLNHVLNNATIDETIIKNPCKALKPLKRAAEPINETKHRALTTEETIKFFAACKDRNSYYTHIFEMMLHSGLRVGEVSALYHTDIDNNYIYVNKTVTRNEIGGYIISETPKTEKGKRLIPLNADLKRIIEEQKRQNLDLFGLTFDKTPLFRSFDGKLLREYTINREIERICKIANIDKFTCHAFRNTFATRFIEQRPQDFKILSEIMGHKDIKITLELYTHVMQENKINAMNEIKIKTS